MVRFRTLLRATGALTALCAVLGLAGPAFAVSSSDAPGIAQKNISAANTEADSVNQVIASARAQERTAESRIADADVLLRSKDYARTIIVLHEVVEKYADHPTAYPDALSMLGEAYFQSRQLLSARRTFRIILDRSNESRMAPYVPRAYTRLVDVALKTQNTKELDEILAKIGAYPQGASEPTVMYARGKALIFKKDWAGAKAALAGVPAGHLLSHQSRYLLGVVAMREAQAQAPVAKVVLGEAPPAAPPTRYAGAIEIFRQVTQLPPDSADHRRVIDLAWLAIGRLFYEGDQWLEAADAYSHVDRQSAEFGTSLYELAWVYVRLGDAERATRALEILAVADPNNAYQADGALLRADLMLRAGQFEKSLTVYRAVRAEYDPMREKVDTFLGSTSDPAVYYDKLSSEQLESVDQTSLVPSLAVQWAREAQDGPAAFAVLDDIIQCRELIRQSQILISKLRTILGASNRVRAFPELRAGDERALQLINRITVARGTIAQGLDDAEPSEVSGELAQVRAERRELQKRLALLPLTDGDRAERDNSADRQWSRVSQRLQQLQLEVDQMNAIVNGLRRMIVEGSVGVSRDPVQMRQWQDELEANERDLRTYKEQIASARRAVESGKLQVGYGDQRFVDDEAVRNAFREKLDRELALVAGGAAGGGSAEYAGRALPVMAQAAQAEAKLIQTRKAIEIDVAKKSAELEAVVQKEAVSIAGYTARLDALDQEARLVVGQVAMRNFGLVRDKLRAIVLRADVGAVEEAWEVREEQITRVTNLRRERDREDRLLQEELHEVLDDTVDPASTPSP
jgi:tetratricopeptide (TPR) repeat protein